MSIASRVFTGSTPASVAAAVQHVDLTVGPLDDCTTSGLRSQVAWVSEAPRRSLQVDLRDMEDRHAVTVLALISATISRAQPLGNKVRVINLAHHHRRDARGFGIRNA
jgi:hypothetical protein